MHTRSYWLLTVGYSLLAIGYWLLTIGYWLSAVDYCLLAVGYWVSTRQSEPAQNLYIVCRGKVSHAYIPGTYMQLYRVYADCLSSLVFTG